MPTIEFTDDQYEQFQAILADLQEAYVGEYGTIRERDAVDYLLDTYTPPAERDIDDASADGIGHRDTVGAVEAPEPAGDAAAAETDLTTVSGIGETKAAALTEAGFETIADLRAATVDALATVDGIGRELAAEIKADLDAEASETSPEGESRKGDDAASDEVADDTDGAGSAAGADDADGGNDAAGASDADESSAGANDTDGESGAGGAEDGAARLESMMSLLDEHEDVWQEGDGDEPYEVELPDGSVESARTKDHVRQLLFKHYR